MNYSFHPRALAEHKKAISYYEEQQKGLGKRYSTSFEEAMMVICEMPQRFGVERQPDIQLASMKIFPYNIIFRVRDQQVQVLAVAHKRRKPGYWENRF